MTNNLGAAAIPMSNDQAVAQQSQDSMKGDDSLPLSLKQAPQIDDATNQMKAYSLADAQMNFTEKKQEFDIQQKDKAVMDAYIASGGKLNSPEDFQKAVATLGPQLSQEGQARLNKLQSDHLVSDIDLTKKINEGSTAEIAYRKEKLSNMAETLDPIVDTYKNSRSMSETPEQKDKALAAFNSSRDAALQMFSQLKGPDGKPVYSPEELKALAPLTPEQMEGTIDHTKYGIAKHEQILNDRVKAASAEQKETQAVYNTSRAEDLPEKEKLAQAKLDQMLKAKALTPESLDSVATAIAKYQLPPLSPMAMRSSQGLALMSKVEELNPDYDSKKFKAMQGTLDKFTYGKGSEVITAFKTADSHLNSLTGVIDKLDNGDSKSINQLGNAWAKEFNLSTAPGDFDAMKQAISQEIEKTFSGSAGALADRQELEKSLDAAKSPENLRSVITDYRTLLQGKIEASKESFKTGMEGSPNFELKKKPETAPADFPKVKPEEQAARDKDKNAILTKELTDEKAALAAATTDEDKHRHQSNVDSITKELGGKSKKDFTAADPTGKVYHFPTQEAADAFTAKVAAAGAQ